MRRVCSECNKPSLRIGMFDAYNQIRCSSSRCIAQYEFESIYTTIASVLTSFLLSLAFLLGFLLQSWLVFVAIGIVIPIILHYGIIKEGRLKLIGLKAELKKKGVKSNIDQH